MKTTKSPIKKGDTVVSKSYGVGEVLEEWGTFTSCRNCFRPAQPYEWLTECCDAPPLTVSGRDIFDIKFRDGKTRSVNAAWLRLLEDLSGCLSKWEVQRGLQDVKAAALPNSSAPPAQISLPEAYLAKLMLVSS